MPSVLRTLVLGMLAMPAVLATPVPNNGNGNGNGPCDNPGQGKGLSKKCSATSSSLSSTSVSPSATTTTTVPSTTTKSTTSSPSSTTATTTTTKSTTSSPSSTTATTTTTSPVVSSMTSSTSSGFRLVTPTKTGSTGALASATGMADAAKAVGRYFGTAVDIPGTGEASDPYYMAVLNNSRNFDQVTPANVMKDSLEPQQNVFNFAGADQFVAIAEATNKIIRCHNLNWYNQLPSWITNPSTPWTNDTLMAALENHIDQVMGHFGDACYHWDVVNEAFNDDGTWRQDVWYNTAGPSYIAVAFQAANAAKAKYGLSTKLYYNDYNIEYLYPKSYMAQSLVKNLTAMGINIDGVGLQSHFADSFTPSLQSQQQNMAAFTALKNAKGANIEVAVTELDVRIADTGSVTSPSAAVTVAAQNQQVQFYWNTVNACATTAGCVGVTVWDFDDTYSWIPSTFSGTGFGDLYYQPGGANTPLVGKATIDAIIDGFENVQPGTIRYIS
ncbi:glycoside hydrolase family 10 protein [Baudoinia panamericana UAMH 10762]|uniref:Beta-xylanase n=1 Tax=Baudoinia panamericana (strain UAMH 10762) TaxID=717646 RepID=M2N124_BAUPA|nr:glycoside hydrolase family 10 protein [Baudoinia panamericana UAMH 10762]EMC97633.1 glycoside hydrolase family 10 protein [Baudoinia panamericana UAMH 10762]